MPLASMAEWSGRSFGSTFRLRGPLVRLRAQWLHPLLSYDSSLSPSDSTIDFAKYDVDTADDSDYVSDEMADCHLTQRL